MDLKQEGFFRELPYGDPDGDSLQQAVGKPSDCDIEKIVSYLSAGHILAVAPGLSRDVLSKERDVIGSLSVMTDGTYAWPNDLIYYLRKYNVRISDDFRAHMQQANWTVPPVDVQTINF